MKDGTFTLRSFDGRVLTWPVKDCPNPAAARLMLEERIGRPVAWRERPSGPR